MQQQPSPLTGIAKLWPGLGRLWASVCWRWFKLTHRKLFAADAPIRESRELQIAYLRSVLRQIPWWSRGHVLLGLAQLELMLRAETRRSVQDIATVRLSGQAALRLRKNRRSRRTSVMTRTTVEARYLEAMAAFLDGQYGTALNGLRPLLAFNNVRYLTPYMHSQVAENAAAAAMVIGEDDLAREYLAQIPPQHLSAEALSAVKLLETKPRQTAPDQEL